MIITRLLGGLGNQMFQYAAGLSLAQRRRTVLKLDVGWFRETPEHQAHNRYALSCFNITEQFATEEEIARTRGRALSRPERWLGTAARSMKLRRLADLHRPGGNWHIQKALRFYPEFMDAPDGTYIDGMWQSERFFSSEASELLRCHFSFRYPQAPAALAVSEAIRGGPSAAVHFRRGDYVTSSANGKEIGVLGPGYYERAVKALREAHPGVTLYVFSDDVDYVESHFKPGGKCVYVRASGPQTSFEDMRLMSLCDHFVISNSTFAWWAAWLGGNPGKLVIAPDPWLQGRAAESADVVPDAWRRIPAAG